MDGLSESVTNTLPQTSYLFRRQPPGGTPRGNARTEQGFTGVDIPDAGDPSLVEEDALDAAAMGLEDGGELRKGHFERFGAQAKAKTASWDTDVAVVHEKFAGPMVKDGYLARDMMERLARRWHEVLKQKHHVFFRQLFLAVGENSPAASARQDQAAATSPHASRSPEAAAILGAADAERKRRLLASYLRGLVASALKVEPGKLAADRALIELGVDSITSVELANRLGADLGLQVSAVDILEASSIEAAAAGLADSLDGRGRPGAGAASGPADGTNGWEEGEI